MYKCQLHNYCYDSYETSFCLTLLPKTFTISYNQNTRTQFYSTTIKLHKFLQTSYIGTYLLQLLYLADNRISDIVNQCRLLQFTRFFCFVFAINIFLALMLFVLMVFLHNLEVADLRVMTLQFTCYVTMQWNQTIYDKIIYDDKNTF